MKRRTRRLLWLVVVISGAASLLGAQETTTTAPRVRAVGRIGMTVESLERSRDFLVAAFGFEPLAETEALGADLDRLTGVFGARRKELRLRLGSEELELHEFATPAGRAFPADSQPNDHWFQHVAIITSDMDRAYAHLREVGIRHGSSVPQTLPDWNPAAGGIRAFYFRDPDGHWLEVLQFPNGKGDARWQARDRLFLGIDHTAIVVADTERSLSFYRDLLGLQVAGTSENWGPEQEQLNGVFGAHLRITALRATNGPGIELLEYLSPSSGRPYPREATPVDLLHWQTNCEVDDVEDLFSAWRSAAGRWISSEIVEGQERRFLARDPDGHALAIEGPRYVDGA